MDTIDVDYPHNKTTVQMKVELPKWGLLDEKAMLRFLVTYTDDLEMHEAHEWFQYRGVRVYDPHRPAPDSILPDYRALS
jgi:hypothetical protein